MSIGKFITAITASNLNTKATLQLTVAESNTPILLTKTTAAQNKITLSYHSQRGL